MWDSATYRSRSCAASLSTTPRPVDVLRTMKLAEYEGADAFDLELQTLDPEYRDAQALELLPAGAVDPACGRGPCGRAVTYFNIGMLGRMRGELAATVAALEHALELDQ